MAEDPLELDDLAADPAPADRVERFFARLLTLQKEFDDPLDLRGVFPENGGEWGLPVVRYRERSHG